MPSLLKGKARLIHTSSGSALRFGKQFDIHDLQLEKTKQPGEKVEQRDRNSDMPNAGKVNWQPCQVCARLHLGIPLHDAIVNDGRRFPQDLRGKDRKDYRDNCQYD